MNVAIVAVALISILLAYVNGANDVSKGVATLAGSGVASYRHAILWGAFWTTGGSIAAFVFSRAMIVTFGKGILVHNVVPTFAAAIATLIGAGLWVGLATRFGLPVSTTHAIVGSIAGVATVAYGLAGVNWSGLVEKIALPLVLSPVASLLISVAILKVWNRLIQSSADCLCAEVVGPRPALVTTSSVGVGMAPITMPAIKVVTCSESERAAGHLHMASFTFDHLHWLTSAATSFARGLNDAPKMVALAVAAAVLSGFAFHISFSAYLLIAFGILVGSLQSGRRVTTVLAEKITPMNHREGFAANLVTSLLVGSGAVAGLPMSTTHVASGAVIGCGVQKGGTTDWQRIRDMALAWVITLPAAALIGVLIYWLIRSAQIP